MRSMTGFGKSRTVTDQLELEIEVRSVNSRYLDVSIRFPSVLSAFEMPVRNMIKKKIVRGKISIYANIKRSSSTDSSILIDQAKINETYNQLKAIKETLNLSDDIKLSHLLNFNDIFEIDLEAMDEKALQEMILNTLEQALESYNKMRDIEGAHILKDMVDRTKGISALMDLVEKKYKSNVQQEFDRLLDNVKNLIAQDKINEDRLNMEIALIADRVDITEECVRMRSHISIFETTLNQNGESGKKLNFILQEMLRETNTMNSKTSNIEVSHHVIKIKEEIEKLREQAQNIE